MLRGWSREASSDDDFDADAATREAKKLRVAELRAALEAAGSGFEGPQTGALVERLVEVRRRASPRRVRRCRPSRSVKRTMIRRLGRRPRSGCGACDGGSRRGNCGRGGPARRRCPPRSRPSDCKLLKKKKKG